MGLRNRKLQSLDFYTRSVFCWCLKGNAFWYDLHDSVSGFYLVLGAKSNRVFA